jgi:simple sugar transport system permease protein
VSETVEKPWRPPPGLSGGGALRAAGEIFLHRREASILLVAIGLMVYFGLAHEAFWTEDNQVNISQALAPAAIIAAGQVLLLVSGEIDLSVGMVFTLCPFLMHYAVSYYGVYPLVAIVLSLAGAAVIGFVNGFITVFFKVPSFVTTLGSLFVIQGITLTTSHAYPAEIPEAAQGLAGWFGRAPWAHLIWAVVIISLLHVVLTRTRWGLHTIAVGGNPVGATEAGIRSGRIKIGNFMITSVLGGFAGILEAFRVQSINPDAGGTEIMFTAVAAAVIGGTALAGGSGTVIGAFLGALVIAVLNNGFNLLGISANPYQLIFGGAILISMILNVYLARLRRAGRT